jgi:dihydrofolate reductase
MTVALVWAQAEGGVIGRDGGLPWHLPEDLAHFKTLTMGSTVVMGRATWDSLPPRFRPLPGRHNVVLSRTPGWAADGATAAGSLTEALTAASGDLWVIGGASVYQEAMAVADRLVVTEIDAAFAGDAYAPQVGAAWQPVHRDPVDGWLESRTGLRYRFITYTR